MISYHTLTSSVKGNSESSRAHIAQVVVDSWATLLVYSDCRKAWNIDK